MAPVMPSELFCLLLLFAQAELRHSRGCWFTSAFSLLAASVLPNCWLYGEWWPSSGFRHVCGGVPCGGFAYGLLGSCMGRTLLSCCQAVGSVSTRRGGCGLTGSCLPTTSGSTNCGRGPLTALSFRRFRISLVEMSPLLLNRVGSLRISQTSSGTYASCVRGGW